MPRRLRTICRKPGCPKLATFRGWCADHAREADSLRGTARQRGYDSRWEHTRQGFLKANPRCIDCGEPATVPDHDPVARRDLVAMGVKDPDAWHRMRPRCKPCHDRKTATVDGGFGRLGLGVSGRKTRTENGPKPGPKTPKTRTENRP